jgi:hypothetical protein
MGQYKKKIILRLFLCIIFPKVYLFFLKKKQFIYMTLSAIENKEDDATLLAKALYNASLDDDLVEEDTRDLKVLKVMEVVS